MPIVILFIVFLICVVMVIVSVTILVETHDHGIPLVAALLFFVLGVTDLTWMVLVGSMDKEVATETYITIHLSPDHYQYITEDDKPTNVTEKLGKIAPDGYVVKKTKYKKSYGGIAGWPIQDDYEFVEAPVR